MHVARRAFGKSLAAVVGSMVAARDVEARRQAAGGPGRLPATAVTRIRLFYPPGYDANGPQAFPQSNLVVLVDTAAGITGIGQGGSPDTVRNVARSVIGRNAFDTEMIWQAAFMDGFYSPGKERLHALGAIDLALWDIKGKALGVPLYQLFGGKTREHIECYATSGLPVGLVTPEDARAMSLKDRAAATMAAGYRVYRVDGDVTASGLAPDVTGGPGGGGTVFDSRLRVRRIIDAVEQIREGVGTAGNWMIDLHQKFDFHEAVEVCRLMEPYRPFCVEDPLREEQFRSQIPKLRLMTSVPLAPGEEWGTRADFSPLVEQRDIDFARASLPNVGGITEMLKIMAVCDTHRVGIVPHFTGPIATAGHLHTMMAFPGQVLMEYNQGERPVPYLPEFLECRNGKVWPNDRPGLGVSVDESRLTFVSAVTEGHPGATRRRPDGSLVHW
ncbi:MAG: mandelate racemase/muconate lactonizing enzyme family protein [Vicinamibacterales bacterium]